MHVVVTGCFGFDHNNKRVIVSNEIHSGDRC